MIDKNARIFISHSSRNIEIVEHFCAALGSLGVDKNSIFCSSIPGQGVSNGEKLNDGIHKAIATSELLVYFISYDFINSPYCVEELGIGWYLSQEKKAECYYLLVPDVEFSEIGGFINSKIDKFTVIDMSHKDDFGLLLENICEKMGIEPPKHSTFLNIEKVFFDAVQTPIEKLIDKKELYRLSIEDQKVTEEYLRQRNQALESQIRCYTEKEAEDIETQKRNVLQIELNTIRSRFMFLGMGEGISKKIYSTFGQKAFFLSAAYRYLELKELLGDDNSEMELFIACIFSYEGLFDEAYLHLIEYVKMYEFQIFPYFYRNIIIKEDNNMQEIIDILKKRSENCPLGYVLDSYKETIASLEKRKRTIKNK